MKKHQRRKGLALIASAGLLAFGALGGCAAEPASPTASPAASPASGSPLMDGSALFSERDLKQTAELSGAAALAAADGEDILITEAGTYVLTGTASRATVHVAAGKDAKVQLVLDGLRIVNTDAPCICVESADKVFVTTAGDSALSVTGSFADGDADAVIFSRDDLVLNGEAKLTIDSSANGVVCRDDLKITGGSYEISAGRKAVAANDSIRIAGGSFRLTAGTDGLHAENDGDDSLGFVYIGGGSFTIDVRDDAIHARSAVQIDEGSFEISAAEGIEATYVQLNGGVLSIRGRDDGINAGRKSSAYRPTVEINGGEITIVMDAGDTDGVDSNGDIIINGGVVSVSGGSTFDWDGSAWLNGGTVICNGRQVDALPNQAAGGKGGG